MIVLDSAITETFREVAAVHGGSLHEYTNRGWQLIAMVENDCVEKVSIEVQCAIRDGVDYCPHGVHRGSYCRRVDSEQRVFPTRITTYLVGRKEGDVLADRAQRIAELEETLRGVASEKLDQVTKASHLEGQLKLEREGREKALKQCASDAAKRTDAEYRADQLEREIGKANATIARLKEKLGTKMLEDDKS